MMLFDSMFDLFREAVQRCTRCRAKMTLGVCMNCTSKQIVTVKRMLRRRDKTQQRNSSMKGMR